MNLKMSSAIYPPFCSGLNELMATLLPLVTVPDLSQADEISCWRDPNKLQPAGHEPHENMCDLNQRNLSFNLTFSNIHYHVLGDIWRVLLCFVFIIS